MRERERESVCVCVCVCVLLVLLLFAKSSFSLYELFVLLLVCSLVKELVFVHLFFFFASHNIVGLLVINLQPSITMQFFPHQRVR